MEQRKQRVVLVTEHHRIVGDLHLPREGYLSRFSDFLNRVELRFISLSDVVVFGLTDDGESEVDRKEFLAVGTDHIRLAYPEGDATD